MKPSSSSRFAANGIGLIVLATLATALLAGFLFSNDWFRDLLHDVAAYSEDNTVLTAGLYVLVQAGVVILLFPGLVFTLLAGYLFGPVVGTIVMVAGTVLGGCVAFLLSRLVFSAYFRRWLEQHPQFDVIAQSVADDGWKTVMLIRTIPLFPFKFSNYCFGAVPLSLRQFAFGTMLGVIPLTVTNVSVGALAADVDSLLQGNASPGLAQYLAIALGIGGGIATFLLVRKRAAARFRQLEQQQSPDSMPLRQGEQG